MAKGEVRTYFNQKFYPFGTIKEKVGLADAKLWADTPGYQEQMGSKLFNEQVKKEAKGEGR